MFSSFSFFVFSSEDQLLSLSQIHPYNLVKLSRIMIQFLKSNSVFIVAILLLDLRIKNN